MMRRRFLVVAGSGLIIPLVPIRPTHATPAQVAALIAQLVGDAEIQEARVNLDLPVMVENGNSVGMTVSVDAPVGDRSQHRRVRRGQSAAARSARAVRSLRGCATVRYAHPARHVADGDRGGEAGGRQLLA